MTTVSELRRLIEVVFVRLYQFAAMREVERRGPDANYTKLRDSDYQLIWQTVGTHPDRPFDRRTVDGEWEAYVDDELISAACIALETAWSKTQRGRCPSKLPRSNEALKRDCRIDESYDVIRWLRVVELLNEKEIKWRLATKSEKKTPPRAPRQAMPTYAISVDPTKPFEPTAVKKSKERRQVPFSEKATALQAIWKLILDRFYAARRNRQPPNREFTTHELYSCLRSLIQPARSTRADDLDSRTGMNPDEERSIRPYITRFNDLWRNHTDDQADLLSSIKGKEKGNKGHYKFRTLVHIEEDKYEKKDGV